MRHRCNNTNSSSGGISEMNNWRKIVLGFLLLCALGSLTWRRVATPSSIALSNDDSARTKATPHSSTLARASPQHDYKIILGFSTGHAGSTTAQYTLLRPACPGMVERNFMFEKTTVQGEKKWPFVSQQDTCERVKNELVPFLHQLAQNETLVDMGHFHNRGRPVLECLAQQLGNQAVFVRIRRNRYDIAMSFAHEKETPCLTSKHKTPSVSLCPSQREQESAGPVYLNTTSDDVWNSFSSFQKFLWYADEVEERWHHLTSTISYQEQNRPEFLQVTWSTSEELENGIYAVRKSLGCSDEEPKKIKKIKRHVSHKKASRNCSDLIRQDLEYRRLMKFDADQSQRLFRAYPQHVDSPDCMDTRNELVSAIRQYSGGSEVNLDAWVLPDNHVE